MSRENVKIVRRVYEAVARRDTDAGLWTIRDSKIIRVVWFQTKDEAREAAGIQE